jgi:hypothetical protein
VRRILTHLALATATLALAGCINSATSILSDSQPVLGERLHLKLYSLHGSDINDDNEEATFAWDGKRYVHKAGALGEYASFTAHPFENGSYILQGLPRDPSHQVEYALMHPIPIVQDGYVTVAIDEADADPATRTKFCKDQEKYSCRIETRDALLAFARATAAKKHGNGGLAIRMPAGPAAK